MSSAKEKNYYEILELPIDANQDEVKQGYIRAKNAYSQDSLALYSLMTKEECDEVLNLIDEAYSIISDPIKRRKYDEARGFNKLSKEAELNRRYETSPVAGISIDPTEKPKANSENTMSKIMAVKRFSL